MKIYGRILRTDREKIKHKMNPNHPLNQGDYYYVGDFIADDGRAGRLNIYACAGKATQFLTDKGEAGLRLTGYDGRFDHTIEPMSWGYEGRGSELLAGWLIMYAISRIERNSGMNESQEVYTNEVKDRERMRRHYKQFAREVIDALPDNWELDIGWVYNWFKKREDETRQGELFTTESLEQTTT